MIKTVEVNRKKYEIDTTPQTSDGWRYSYVDVCRVTESPASGVIANVLRELGKEPVTKTLTIIGEQEKKEVVLALGHKFSRSKAWQNTFDYYSRR